MLLDEFIPQYKEYWEAKNLIKIHRRKKFQYKEFIGSEFWEAQKKVWYYKHGKKCAVCRKEKNVHLHHKIYPKNYRYLMLKDNAFMALCCNCHKTFHTENGVRQNMQRSSIRWFKRKQLKYQHQFLMKML